VTLIVLNDKIVEPYRMNDKSVIDICKYKNLTIKNGFFNKFTSIVDTIKTESKINNRLYHIKQSNNIKINDVKVLSVKTECQSDQILL